MPTIAVVSHIWEGHVPAYHGLLIERFHQLGFRTISLCPAQSDLPPGEVWRSFGSSPRPIFAVQKASGMKLAAIRGLKILRSRLPRLGLRVAIRGVKCWLRLGAALRKLRMAGEQVDFVFLVFLGNGFIEGGGIPSVLIDRVVRIEWGGIWNNPILRGEGPRSLIEALVPRESALRARNSRFVWVPDPRLADELGARQLHASVFAMPEIARLDDPREDDPRLARIRQLADGRPIVSLLGSISLRKGILAFIEAAKIAYNGQHRLFFLMAGEFTEASCGYEYPAIKAATESPPSNLLFIPERIADGADFNALVGISEILCIAYLGFPYQSNLLTKAAHFKKPVIVSDHGVMADCVREFELGACVPAGDALAILASADALLAQRRMDGRRLEPRFEDYEKRNSVIMLDDLISTTLSYLQSIRP